MYRVMIVEDELLVRIGIKNSIHWDAYEMIVVADVADGAEAWEVYEREKPDIILTDIKMGRMDGIELIKRIREGDTTTRIIILSCLEDFHTARQAAGLGVTDYILKLTMSFEEMGEVLAKARTELKAMNRSEVDATLSRQDLDWHKEKLFKDYLFYGAYTEEEFGLHIKQAKADLSPGKLIVVTMDIEEYDKLKKTFKDEKDGLIRFSLLNMMNEVLGSYKRGEAFHEKECRFVFLFSFGDFPSELRIKEELQRILLHITRALNSFFNVHVTFGIGGMKNRYAKLREGYREAVHAVSMRYFVGNDRLITFDSDLNVNKQKEAVSLLLRLPDGIALRLSEMGYRTEGFKERLIEACPRIIEDKQAVVNALTYVAQQIALVKDKSSGNPLTHLLVAIDRIVGAGTMEEAIKELMTFVEQTESSGSEEGLSREVQMAIKHMNQNYDKDISLHGVADKIGLSPNYFSSLFKKELQVNFVEYLNGIRIRKAQEYLKFTNLKSYEIADKIGFAHDTYFNRLFKKITGMTPNEYRRTVEIRE